MQTLLDFVKRNWFIILLVLIGVGVIARTYMTQTKKPETYMFNVSDDGIKRSPHDDIDYLREEVNVALGNNQQFISSNLLPKDENMNSDDMEFAPAPDMNGKNFVDSRFKIGMQSQVTRNANLSIRADPHIPKTEAGPWSQSTIEPEIRRPLEIGTHS